MFTRQKTKRRNHAGGPVHSHGGGAHPRLPAGADGGRMTRRKLPALGVSGWPVRPLLAAGAAAVAGLGALVCYEALAGFGFDLKAGLALLSSAPATPGGGALSSASVLGLGFGLGLKHAVEADHLAAVSAIVSERKSLLGSSLVGGLWGLGHTISLAAAGVAVILLNLRIGERAALALEFCVALMLIGLGANAIRKLWRGATLHLHPHAHSGRRHLHPHLHGPGTAEPAGADTHHGLKLGARPLVVGMVHGLAGSAALMLLILATIPSRTLGMLYVLIFGAGSVGGMMIMSALVGLPLYLTAKRGERANLWLRWTAGAFSLCFGLLMAYEIGYAGGLFRS